MVNPSIQNNVLTHHAMRRQTLRISTGLALAGMGAVYSVPVLAWGKVLAMHMATSKAALGP